MRHLSALIIIQSHNVLWFSISFHWCSLDVCRWRDSGTSIGVTWLFLFSFFFKNLSPYVTSSVCLLNHVAKILYTLCLRCINILSGDGNLVSHCLSATAFPLSPCPAATFIYIFYSSLFATISLLIPSSPHTSSYFHPCLCLSSSSVVIIPPPRGLTNR